MEPILKPGTVANRIAKVISIILALGVLSYLVYCAHDAARGQTKKTYMPSSKSGNPRPFEPTPGELVTEPAKDGKKKPAPKKKKGANSKADTKRVFIHTSKSGNFDILKKKKPDQKK